MFHRPAREQRPGDQNCRHAHHEAPEQHQPHARVQRLHRHDGTGMRRHESVHHGQRGEQRNRQMQERLLRLARQRQQNREQQDQPHGKPRRQSDREREHDDAPLNALRAEERGEPFRQHVRPAGLGEQLAEHGAETEDRGDAAQRGRQSVLQ